MGGRYDFNYDQLGTTSIGAGLSLGWWEYNLNQEYVKEQLEKFSLSAIYDDECTRVTFSYENRYPEVGSSAPITSLTFRVN